MLALTDLPKRYLDTYGREKVAEIVGVNIQLVTMWVSRKKFPLDAVEKLLAFDPAPLDEIKPLYPKPDLGGKKLAILLPCDGNPEPKTIESVMKLYDPKEMVFKHAGFNNSSVVRNMLAAWFLASDCDWSFWIDADTVAPCGDAKWFKETCDLPNMPDVFAGVHSIYRMLVHKRLFVSGCYVARRPKGAVQFQGGESPAMRASIKRGPRDELMEREWVGFGCALVHRKVFEDIIAQQGSEIEVKSADIINRFGYRHAIFSPTTPDMPGDDLPMCYRAVRAGHKPVVDLAVFAGHCGTKAFNYTDL